MDKNAGYNKVFNCKKVTQMKDAGKYVKLDANASINPIRLPGIIRSYERTQG
jgi:hypothetical protein